MDDEMMAVRAQLTGHDGAAIDPEHVRERALHHDVRGWVRGDAPAAGPVAVHAEGAAGAVQAFLGELSADAGVTRSTVKVEGHEQFAVRGVSAGAFVVQEHQASTHHYDLRLEVEGVMRSWAVPKGPSMDPKVKRLAVQVEDHALSHNDFEGTSGRGGVIIWDRGSYEQGGRVPWPEAVERGHAVFVLHGDKLRGGFALQRTRETEPAQWLLIKRRDDAAQPGSDVTAQQPRSVVSDRTLAELLES